MVPLLSMTPALRARTIAEWRGLPEPPKRPDRLVSVAESIAPLMSSLGLGERFRQEEVLRTWRSIVGDFIATHSQPTRLRGGVLYVQVLQSTMHYELDRMWKQKLLSKLREQFGPRAIRDIRFCLG